MITRKFALIVLASSFLGAGAVHASVFPDAAEESVFGLSVNAPLPTPTNAADASRKNSAVALDALDFLDAKMTGYSKPERIDRSLYQGSALPSQIDSD